MNYTDIKPDAIYRLAVDVKNPHPDRRYKGQANMEPVWKKGTRFLAREEVYEDVIAGVEVRVAWFRLEFIDRQHGGLNAIPVREKASDRQRVDNERASAILAALEPAEEDFKAFMARLRIGDGSLKKVIERLCASGALSTEQIENEYNAWMSEPED